MSGPKHPRRPQVFAADDPAITTSEDAAGDPPRSVSPHQIPGHHTSTQDGPVSGRSAPDGLIPGRLNPAQQASKQPRKTERGDVPHPDEAPPHTQAYQQAGPTEPTTSSSDQTSSGTALSYSALNHARLKRRFGWGALFLSAVGSLAMLAATSWAINFVTQLINGNNYLSWAAVILLAIALLSALVLALRELIGLMRLRHLTKFRRDVQNALAQRDLKAERKAVRRLKALYTSRPDMSWSLARLREHENDIQDPGDLLHLADRDLMMPLDVQARQLITDTAKRISLVTAISPIAMIDVAYVLVQNLALLRQLGTLYGARPGFIGSMRLAKLVAVHIVATGGLALTDDLFGQVLGQDLLRRLSHRLGEGVFNGILCARIGVAAIEVIRPLPHIASEPVRLRDLVPLIFRKADSPAPD